MRCLVWSIVAIAAVAFGTAGCDGPGASLAITGARASRAPDGRVDVDVDLVASEGLGGNIGVYCTRATFVGQANPAELCSADLEDGDTKTVRLTSERWMPPGTPIAVRVRVAAVEAGRSIVAPP